MKHATTSAVTGAALGTSLTSSPTAFAATPERVEDMTHELHRDFPTFSGESGFEMTQTYNYKAHSFNLFTYNMNEHTGTHIDAPLHFSADGLSVSEIPVTQLVVPLCVVDIADRAAADPDTQVTPDDIKAWIKKHGPIPENSCIAMHSGWARKVNSYQFRNADTEGEQHFPGFHVDATNMLLEETSAIGLAVDTLSLDYGRSDDFATHYAWLPTNRWGIENIANLDKIPPAGATLVVGAPKHRGGTGGPSRLFALI